jgi:hypothetical protein
VSERRTPEDGGRRRHADHEADQDLVGPELVEESREVEIEREGEVLEEVGAEAEDELPGEEGRPWLPGRR